MVLSAAIKSAYPFLEELGIEDVNAGCFDGEKWSASGAIVETVTPITGKAIGPKVQLATAEDVKRSIANMESVKAKWMKTPAPKRGEIVREIGNELRKYLQPLGSLLSLEVGKISAEGLGEVQEYIDICDFATGLSRQLPGQVIPSERPGHFMMEQWHPLGNIGIIAAFNFPVAVAGWNTAISMIAGNTQIWKCAPTTTLCSIATQRIVTNVLKRYDMAAVSTFVAGDRDIGERIVDDRHISLVSFTGSCEAGRKVGQKLAGRHAKSLLELGGNNAIVVLEDADLEIALRSVAFGAVGTCGQRCTTTRRLYLQSGIYDRFVEKLVQVYKQFKVGNPLDAGVLVGPLHTAHSVSIFESTIERAKATAGAKILVGGKRLDPATDGVPGPNYVQPTIIEVPADAEIVRDEAFVPILFVMKVATFEEAIERNNSVEQGLSSALFTNSVRNALHWTSAVGADSGIVNVNVPTNGAEIGGAFGGEKATGGGRESGSDAWKQYMRRATTTINYSKELPLAQGINFTV